MFRFSEKGKSIEIAPDIAISQATSLILEDPNYYWLVGGTKFLSNMHFKVDSFSGEVTRRLWHEFLPDKGTTMINLK